MAKIENEPTSSLFELITKIDEYFTHYDEYIFRGQADDQWELEPTLTRALKKRFPDGIDPEYNWKNVLNSFKKNIRGRININIANEVDDELWALGQHHGLFTPLLDWTRSPYVALFFSLIGECKSGQRCLWALCDDAVAKSYISQIEDDPENQVKIIDPMGGFNHRLVSQNGLFLYVPPTKSLEKEIGKIDYTGGGVVMFKISFPDAIRNDLLAALDRRNINFGSLFPDLHGAALSTNSAFELEPYLEQKRQDGWDKNSGYED